MVGSQEAEGLDFVVQSVAEGLGSMVESQEPQEAEGLESMVRPPDDNQCLFVETLVAADSKQWTIFGCYYHFLATVWCHSDL